jgi:hypothetical protein
MQSNEKPEWLPTFNSEIDEHFHLEFTFDERDEKYPVHLPEDNPGVTRDTGYNIIAYIESITGMRAQEIGKLIKANKKADKYDVLISAHTLKELSDFYGTGFFD